MRRIGKAIAEQVELYGALTGEREIVAPEAPPVPPKQETTADVLPFRKESSA